MIKVKKPPFYFRVLDYLLMPVMYVLGGFKRDSIQETHFWHVRKFENLRLNEDHLVEVKGNDESSATKNVFKELAKFHMPIFGGWKNYVVLKNTKNQVPWYVGWGYNGTFFEINRLQIKTNKIKLLKGPKGSTTAFFALDNKGNQIPLKQIDEGVLGDMKYPDVRLF